MKRIAWIALILVVGGALAGGAWWYYHREADSDELALYGNIDLRQVDLAFNNNQRIVEVLVEEGDRVERGQVVARLDTNRLQPQVLQADAQVAAQRQVVERLHNGTRPEEIDQARANLRSAEADAANARVRYDRLKSVADASQRGAVSEQDIDNAQATLLVADAQVEVARAAFDLAEVGPRKEDIAEAEARLRASEAQLALLQQELADATLVAPVDAVVRTRVMEPGEMASPQRPVLVLAITDPKWVRAYVTEPDLGKIREGMPATIAIDSFPDHRFNGWVGFISPIAEFTPKNVQTDELRTSLVYEVRVFTKDPENRLHLGMPATVHLSLDQDPVPVSGAPAQAAARPVDPTEAGP
ncbi:MAG: efflux RND transporter periplasmic adaptor subunit [Pirellulales bacterium]